MPLVDPDSPQVRFPPPLIFLGCLLLGFAADHWLDLPMLTGRWPYLGGWALTILGSLSIGASLGLFFSNKTNPEPWKKDTKLIAKGIYRLSRNPMYLGMGLAGLGIALAMGSLGGIVGSVVAILLVDRFVIAREERYLEQQFGEEYRAYRAQTRRWI